MRFRQRLGTAVIVGGVSIVPVSVIAQTLPQQPPPDQSRPPAHIRLDDLSEPKPAPQAPPDRQAPQTLANSSAPGQPPRPPVRDSRYSSFDDPPTSQAASSFLQQSNDSQPNGALAN